MANFFEDNQDLQFYLKKWIDWEPLISLTEYDYKAEEGLGNKTEALEFYEDILNLVGGVAADEIAPVLAEVDKIGLKYEKGEIKMPPQLEALFESFKEMELYGMCLPRELGGMNCPMILYFITSELISRADASVMTHYGFHGGIAMALLLYSLLEGSTEFQTDPPRITKTRFESQIKEIITGQAWGSMDITEPDAGSDMAALRCVGEQDEQGNWYLSGSKILISSGHGKYHLVIARTEPRKGEGLAGLKGLSLFLVPAYEDLPDGSRKRLATVDGMEKKLGHNASATVTVTFDHTPGYLIGKRGEGFKLMLMLMNNARIGVGFESLGVCEAAYRIASEYATQRPSMGKTIDQHEMIADYLEEMKTDIQGIRALAMEAAYHEEISHKLRFKLDLFPPVDENERKTLEKEMKRHQNRARMLTPLLKYYAAEKAVLASRRAIQILGGYGYTKDYGAEKLLRDAIVFPIYEGTSQIQALMAMKDTMTSVMKKPQEFYKKMLLSRTESLINMDTTERRIAKIQYLCASAVQNLIRRVFTTKVYSLKEVPFSSWIDTFTKDWDPKRDFAPAMLHAERLTQMLADQAICEILAAQAKKHAERKDVLDRFLERAELRVSHLYEVITTTGTRLLDTLKQSQEKAS